MVKDGGREGHMAACMAKRKVGRALIYMAVGCRRACWYFCQMSRALCGHEEWRRVSADAVWTDIDQCHCAWFTSPVAAKRDVGPTQMAYLAYSHHQAGPDVAKTSTQ